MINKNGELGGLENDQWMDALNSNILEAREKKKELLFSFFPLYKLLLQRKWKREREKKKKIFFANFSYRPAGL